MLDPGAGPEPNAPLGVLLVTGNHTHQENYGRAFAADPRCVIVGVVDEEGLPARRQEFNRRLADEMAVPLLDSYEDALDRGDVQIVSICAEPERRAGLTRQAIQAGKHVYVDKEPAATYADAVELSQLADEFGVKSQSFSLVRTDLAERARRVLAARPAGWLQELHCEMFFAKGFPGTADLTRPRCEQTAVPRLTFFDSKRELLCVGWYPLVLFHWLTGRRYEQVQAVTGNYFFSEHQSNDVEDFASMLLEMQGGIGGSVTVGRSGWQSHPGFGIHQVTLVGDGETVTLDAFQPRLETHSEATAWRSPTEPHPEDPMGFWSSTQAESGMAAKTAWSPLGAVHQSDAAVFVDHIRAGRPSDVNLTTAAHVLGTVFAGYESAATGQWAIVPDATGATSSR